MRSSIDRLIRDAFLSPTYAKIGHWSAKRNFREDRKVTVYYKGRVVMELDLEKRVCTPLTTREPSQHQDIVIKRILRSVGMGCDFEPAQLGYIETRMMKGKRHADVRSRGL